MTRLSYNLNHRVLMRLNYQARNRMRRMH